MLDQVTKDKISLGRFTTLTLSRVKFSTFCHNIHKDDVSEKHSTLEMATKVLNSMAFHNNIIHPKFKSGGRTVLVWKGYEISLKEFSTRTHPNFSEATKNPNQTIKRYLMESVSKIVSKINLFCVFQIQNL